MAVVVGTARTTWSTTFTVARVTIPRSTTFQPPAPATIQWSTPSGAPGASYLCFWESGAHGGGRTRPRVRRYAVRLIQHRFAAQRRAARTLSVAGAYGEAGIQTIDTGATNVIATPAGGKWNDASLHHAMQTHFSKWAEKPQFKVWLMHAKEHELTDDISLLGIMFDQQGLQRQGCASFYKNISSGRRRINAFSST